jgi:hypothetical protein
MRLALTVMCAAVAVLATPVVQAATTSTSVRAITPVDGTGGLAAGYVIAHRYGNANCESGSPTVGKAYQCFTPASPVGIYDACWVQANHHFVLCLVKPWQRKVARLHVTRGYGDSSGFLTVHKPWGVRTGSRVRCLIILGPVHTIHGKPRTYLCNKKIVLAGKVTHHGDVWTAHEYRKVRHRGRPTSYPSLGKHTAAVVWFGQPSVKD